MLLCLPSRDLAGDRRARWRRPLQAAPQPPPARLQSEFNCCTFQVGTTVPAGSHIFGLTQATILLTPLPLPAKALPDVGFRWLGYRHTDGAGRHRARGGMLALNLGSTFLLQAPCFRRQQHKSLPSCLNLCEQPSTLVLRLQVPSGWPPKQ